MMSVIGAAHKVRRWAVRTTVLHPEGELGMQDGQWWRGDTRPGGGGGLGGGSVSAVEMAAHNAERWAAPVRGSALGVHGAHVCRCVWGRTTVRGSDWGAGGASRLEGEWACHLPISMSSR